MKPLRLLLVIACALAALVLIGTVVAFNSGFQTWAARRAIARQPGLAVTIGAIDAGLHHADVKDLRYEKDGVVLTLPALHAELPLLSAGLHRQAFVERIVAQGWTLDLSKTAPSPRAGASAAPAAVAQAFQGVFAQLHLPVDLSLDGVDLSGEVILPEGRGRIKITLTGGGLAVGREGNFNLLASAALTGSAAPVSSLDARVAIAALMDSPRTFTRLTAKADAAASGAQFPQGVKLRGDFAAARGLVDELYDAVVVSENKQLAVLHADFPLGTHQLAGTWKLNVRDADVAPFALGRRLPAFTAVGEGKFDADDSFAAVHATGRLSATVDQLTAVLPELSALGPIGLVSEFELSRRGDVLDIERLVAEVTGAKPVATVRSLQAFVFNAKTGAVQAADVTRGLFGLSLLGVPLAWAQPFLKTLAVTGGDLHGELVARAHDGGLSVRAKSPLTLAGVAVTQGDKALVSAVDVSIDPSADYAPQGWQAEIVSFTAKSGGATLLSLTAKAGQLAGSGQPIKAAGKFSANLPAALAQPVAGDALRLTGGELAGDFVASIGALKEIQGRLAVRELAVDKKISTEKLPTLSFEVRADVAADGKITLSAPLVIERDGRKSDLAVSGTVMPGKTGLAIDAKIASAQLIVDDAKIFSLLASPVAEEKAPAPTPSAARDAAPPWAGINGQIAVALQKVVYSDAFQVSDVTGLLRIQEGELKIETVRAELGEGSDAKFAGTVTFEAAAPQPYGLTADLAVTEFNPAPLLRALNPGQPATVEGKFSIASTLGGRAPNLGGLAAGAGGDFQLTSKGGTYRGLPVSIASKTETAGKIASGLAAIGSFASSVVGKGEKPLADITSKAQALSEFTGMLSAIAYDQLNVVVTRDASLNTVLKDFTLISPEMRLSGGGRATHQPEKNILEDALAMEFRLRARGRTADLMKYLGVLDGKPDDLGYAAFTLPLKVGGTLGKPEAGELSRTLASLALEKSGVTDKASELFNKLIGVAK